METKTLTDDVLQNTKFLVVDDELSNIRILEQMLGQLNCFNVFSTTQSSEAIDLFQSSQPDIVLLDLMMPELNGFEVMDQLKALIPDDVYLPIVILTSDITPQSKRKALAGGAKDFLTKPFDKIELSLRIFNLIETRHYYLKSRQNSEGAPEDRQVLGGENGVSELARNFKPALSSFIEQFQHAEPRDGLTTGQKESFDNVVETGQRLLASIDDLQAADPF